MVTEDLVWSALETVKDPEVPVSIVALGLINGIALEGSEVAIQVTFTSLGCACMDWIVDDIKAAVGALQEISSVHVDVVWNDPWTKERMTVAARNQLGKWGIQA